VVLDEVAGRVPADPRRAAWMRREWWARSTAWVDDRLGDVGLARTGDLEPREYWAISAVARVPITDGAAWLKAVPPIFAREPAVLAVLNEAAPGRVPSVIAAAEGADGSRFLMEDAGEVPDDVDDADRPRLAALLAGLQVRTLDAVPRLVAAGCADRSPATLAGELRRMADDGAELDLLHGAERDALRGSGSAARRSPAGAGGRAVPGRPRARGLPSVERRTPGELVGGGCGDHRLDGRRGRSGRGRPRHAAAVVGGRGASRAGAGRLRRGVGGAPGRTPGRGPACG
jgi:hypothetical protein